MMMRKEVKEKFVLACCTLMLAGWLVVFIWGKPTPPLSANSSEAKTTGRSHMKEFCHKVYGESGCLAVDVFGKQGWIVTVSIPSGQTHTSESIAETLLSIGWTRSGNVYERKTVFCKGTFGAVVEHPSGPVDFVVFVSSSDDCKN